MDLVSTFPDEILHKVFSFIANSPTMIGPSICHTLRPLSKICANEIDSKIGLWELCSKDLECDFYRKREHDVAGAEALPIKSIKRVRTAPDRRSSRLQPASPKDTYIKKYSLLMLRNQTAFDVLQELVVSKKKSLSLARLRSLLREFRPVAINRRVRSGGTYLVEVTRARHVKESIILKCVRHLVEECGANPNVPSAEIGTGTLRIAKRSAGSDGIRCMSESTGRELYALVIAAARGMHTVVAYLLTAGARRDVRGSSRFRLLANMRKTVKGDGLTSLEFALKMKEAEEENGASREDLRGILKVIDMLKPSS
mmetsp:Transcript_35283/g.79525  ORF Transcript_35283/g.79525 Transcript_35283/m.79525 type:complete len:312 (-) Transcript_35283:1044-1979(-)